MTESVLAADIGGTNTRLQLFTITSLTDINNLLQRKCGCQERVTYERNYMNADYPTFNDALRQFFVDASITKPPIAACLAVAGPVANNTVKFTNRSAWTIVGEEVSKSFNISKVHLINDFVAVGYGLFSLDNATECIALQDAPRSPHAPVACIGAGTGLGECFLTPDASGHYTCFPTEGGHAEFAPRNDLECRLLNFLKQKFAQKHRISVERIISGPGLINVYEFLAHENPDKVDPVIAQELLEAGDNRGKVIATNTQNELCQKTMEIFIAAYGAEAGVAALKYLPQGGLYLTGGLTPKNIDLIKVPDGPFIKAFRDKGRVSGILDTVPVYAVLVEDLGQRGALRVALLDSLSILKEKGFGGGEMSWSRYISHGV